MKLQDLTKKRFGRLVVVKRVENNSSNRVCWLCQCDCGKEVVVDSSGLKQGTKSCGCLQKETAKTLFYKDSRSIDLTSQNFKYIFTKTKS